MQRKECVAGMLKKIKGPWGLRGFETSGDKKENKRSER